VLPNEEVRTMTQTPDPGAALRAVRTHLDSPLASCSIVVAAESADSRSITIQVRDRLGKAWAQPWRVRIRLSGTANGAAVGGHTVSFAVGTVVETITVGGEWEVRASAAGTIGLSVTIAGSATRFIMADVLGKERASAAAGWAP